MQLFTDDPAFPFVVNAMRPIRKQGEFTDEKGHTQSYDSIVLQCTWEDVSGEGAICVARPVADFKPDLAKIKGRIRLGVVSASSKGGMLTLRFSGWEPAPPSK